MKNIYNASQKYVLAMEYYWPELKQIEYHCNNNTASGLKIKTSLRDTYNIDILNVEIKAGRGHHYDLLVHSRSRLSYILIPVVPLATY